MEQLKHTISDRIQLEALTLRVLAMYQKAKKDPHDTFQEEQHSFLEAKAKLPIVE